MTTKKNDSALSAAGAPPPAYLTKYGNEGLDDKLDIVTATPRLRVVQAMTDKDTKKAHGEGSVVLMPDDLTVAKPGETFEAVPLYRWVSWQKWADIKDVNAPSPVMEESTDPTSALALAAKNPASREEAYEGGIARNVEAINLIVRIETGPAEGVVAIYSFARSGHKHGARIVTALARQGAKNVPIYAQRIALRSEEETNRDNQTYWVLRGDHAPNPWLDEERIPQMRELYAGFDSMLRSANK